MTKTSGPEPKDTSDDSVSLSASDAGGAPGASAAGRSSSSAAWASGAVGGVGSEPGAEQDAPGGLSRFVEQLESHAPRHARYVAGPEIARGGMGQILRVRDADLRRHLAMKVMLGDPADEDGKRLARFLEEAQVTGQLDHPGIVPVHDLGVDEQGRLYFTMQLVKGRDLSAIFELVREGREGWTQTRAIGVLLKACEALAYAHSKGVTHRDLKPGNIMVGRFGEVYVMDWGLAKVQGRPDVRDLRLRGDEEEEGEGGGGGGGEGAAKAGASATQEQGAPAAPAAPAASTAKPAPKPDAPSSANTDAPVAAASPAAAAHDPPHDVVTSLRGEQAGSDPGSPLVTMDGDVVGTPAYMSPEQAKGDMEFVGPRSDVYAMGAILYELLSGQMPHVPKGSRPQAREVLDAVKRGKVAPLRSFDPDVRPELEAICAKAMQYEPIDRYTSVLELAEDLRAFLEGRVVGAHDRGLGAQASKWVRRNKVLVYVAASAAIAGIWSLVGALGAQRTSNEEMRQASEQQIALQAEAVELTKRAETARLSAEWQSYLGRLRLASLHLAAGRPDEAAQVLDECPAEQRGWEWRYLKLRLDPALLEVPAQGTLLAAVAISADGRRLVHEAPDARLRVWDVDAATERAPLVGHEALVHAVALSADGSRAVSGSRDRSVRVWDVDGDAKVALLGHEYEVRAVAISADGRYAASASGEDTALVWDVSAALEGRSHAPIARLRQPGAKLLSVALSADGTRVATGSDDGFVRVWDVEEPDEPVIRLETVEHVGSVGAMAYSANGFTLVSGGADRTVRVWNVRTGRGVTTLRGHEAAVRSVAVSADGQRVASTADDDTVRLWDVPGTKQIAVVPGQTGWPAGVSLDAAGWRMASLSAHGGARVWSIQAPGSLAVLDNAGAEVNALALSGDGRRMVTGGADALGRTWDAQIGRRLQLLDGHSGGVNAVACSADGKIVATGSNDSTARLWDGETGALLHQLSGHDQRVQAVAVSADGTRVVTGANDHQARVWDVETGRELFALEGHDGPVLAAAYGARDSLIATGSADGTVMLWSAPTGERQLVLRGHAGRVTAVAFGPDGALVASGADDRTARVWNAVSGGTALAVMSGHAAGVNAVAVSPDGRRVATGSDDHTVRVWDVRTGEALLLLREHRASVRAVAFDPTGRRLVSGSTDGTLRIWESDLDAARRMWRHTDPAR